MATLTKFLGSAFFISTPAPEKAGGYGDDYGREPWRAPDNGDDKVVIELPGRVVGNVCHRSHYFRVCESGTVFVRHGAGQESFSLGYDAHVLIGVLERAADDEQYLIIRRIYETRSADKRAAAAETEAKIFKAFSDGRLKKRKQRGSDKVKVWIDCETHVTKKDAA